MMAMFLSHAVMALGLGELKVNSTLNMQLNAEVELTQPGNLTIDEILPNLATEEDFKRAGIERTFALMDLKFEVVRTENKVAGQRRLVVKITSSRPIVEPYLNFLVEILWPTGRILKEFTILLDPPSYDVEGVQPLRLVESHGITPLYTEGQSSSRSRTPKKSEEREEGEDFKDSGFKLRPFTETAFPEVSDEVSDEAFDDSLEESGFRLKPYDDSTFADKEGGSDASVVTIPSPRRTVTQGQLQGNKYGMTQRGDTLWSIARRAISAKDAISVQQAMLAIHRANPEAFINENINLLKAGYVLRIPDFNEMGTTPRSAAIAQVEEHHRAFQAYKSGKQDALPSSSVAVRDAMPQLDATDSGSAMQADKSEGTDGQLKIVSSGSQSGSQSGTGGQGAGGIGDAAQMEEMDSLRRENAELRIKLDDLNNQMETIDSILALKQDELASLQQSLQEGGEGVPQTPQDSDNAEVQASVKSQSDTPEDSGPVVSDPGTAPLKRAKKPEGIVENILSVLDSVLEAIKDNLVILGGVLGAVLLAVAGLMFMKNRKASPANVSSDLPPIDLASVDEEEIDELDLSLQDADPIDAADAYIEQEAYGKAEVLLRNAISEDEDRSDLRLKLLEVFVHKQDASGFNSAFSDLQATGDDSAINIARQMQQQISGASGIGGLIDDDEDFGSLDDLDLGLDNDSDALGSLGDDSLDLGLDDTGDDLDLGAEDSDDLGLDLGGDSGGDDFDLDLGSDDDDLGLDLDSGDDEFSLDLDGGDDDMSLDLDAGDDISLDMDSGDDEFSLDLNSDDDELSLDMDSGDDELSLDMGSDDEFSLDLDTGDGDELSLDMDTGSDDDFALELDTGDNDADGGDDLDLGGDLDLDDDAFSFDDDDLNLDDVDLDLDGMDFGDDSENKLDLARAYIDMGDKDEARNLLQQVVKEGSSADVKEANELLEQIG